LPNAAKFRAKGVSRQGVHRALKCYLRKEDADGGWRRTKIALIRATPRQICKSGVRRDCGASRLR